MSSRQGLFPREGVYIDPIASIIKKTILHPIFALCTLVYIKLNESQRPQFQTPVLYGAIASLLLWINEFISRNSANNWTSDATYDWKKEIVVVTGRSSGIGASVAQRPVADSVRVVVLDVAPATSNFGKWLTL